MKRKLPPFHDLIKTIDIRLLMIRVEEPNRENCSWSIGLIDKSGEPSLNYFKCETETKATELIDSILSRYEDLERGQDIGNLGDRIFVYLKTTN